VSKRGSYRCVFCGEPATSKQHVWPRWMRKAPVGRATWESRTYSKDPHVKIFTDYAPESNTVHITTELGPNARPPQELTKKIVCPTCNNGWMSRVETDAQPVLSQLMDDTSGVVLSEDDARAIRRWVLLTWAVFQYDDRRTRVFDERDDADVREGREPGGVVDVWWVRSADPANNFRIAHLGGPVLATYESRPGHREALGRVGQCVLAAGPAAFIARYAVPADDRFFNNMSLLSGGIPERVARDATWPAKDFSSTDWQAVQYGEAGPVTGPVWRA